MGKKNTFQALFARKPVHIDEKDLPIFEHSKEVGEKIITEGAVLLKNRGLLPLAPRKVNVFGTLAASPHFGGNGSGATDGNSSVGFFTALTEEGFTYNETLYNLFKNWSLNKKATVKKVLPENELKIKKNYFVEAIGGMSKSHKTMELPQKHLTDEIMKKAVNFSDVALVMLGRGASEQHDYEIEDLRFTKEERELLEKVCAYFTNVVVLINSASPMEIGALEEYHQIKAIMYIGFPGTVGMYGVAKLLSGKHNPSGRISDTWFYDIETIPAVQNRSGYIYEGTEKRKGITGKRFGLQYKEDIYVGYRYAETFLDSEEYRKQVQYPFGYGLSFTEFLWENLEMKMASEDIEISVTVKNCGNFSGKDVIELFVELPYTGKVEKAKRVLVGFAKTGSLAPNEEETVKIFCKKKDFSSYSSRQEAFVLEAGEYLLELCRDAHTVVLQKEFQLEEKTYQRDEVTGTTVRNRLQQIEGDFVKFSRKNPRDTFPKPPHNHKLSPSKAILECEHKLPPVYGGEMPITGRDSGIRWRDLKGKPYDDEIWQKFVEQLTYEEMRDEVVYGGWQTLDIPRLGVPEGRHLDGPAGFECSNDKKIAFAYPTESIVACTWNTKLLEEMGVAIGSEANVYGIHFWYGPAMNTHRGPMGGRCYEYYSEDGLLAGKLAAAVVRGVQSKKVIPMIKHFAINEEDNHRVDGHYWVSEQAAREIYLKPFEICIKEGNAMGIMTAFNYIGEKWAAEDENLMLGILREEWGFEGCAISDSALTLTMRPDTGVTAGNDLWLTFFYHKKYLKMLDKQYERDPEGLLRGLQRACKNILWAHSNTRLME